MTLSLWAAFVAASSILLLIPGPTVLLVVSYALGQGWRTALPMAVGVALGDFTAMTLSMLGLGALLAASATLFTVLKWVGAAYLVWTGIVMLRSAGQRVDASAAVPSTSMKVFWQGAATNALNPKVALFFLAFLPQFIAPGSEGQAVAFIVLGLLFNAGGAVVNIGVALLAGAARERWAARAQAGAGRFGAWLQRAAGALFIVLGVKLAFSSR